jgi:hypothetical protein
MKNGECGKKNSSAVHAAGLVVTCRHLPRSTRGGFVLQSCALGIPARWWNFQEPNDPQALSKVVLAGWRMDKAMNPRSVVIPPPPSLVFTSAMC